MAFYNLARMYTETTGTGTVTLTSAVPGCLTFALAGVADGATVNYGIITYDLTTHRPTHAEVGTGTYTASGTTLARTTVEKSTNSNNKITLTGLSEVYLCPLASDFAGFGGGVSFAIYRNNGAADTVNNGASLQTLSIVNELVDADGIATLGSNTITITADGYYETSMVVQVTAAGAFNGKFFLFDGTAYGKYFPFITADGIISALLYFPPYTMAKSATDTIVAKLTNNSGVNVSATVLQVVVKKLS